MDAKDLSQSVFIEEFNQKPLLICSPGRVNLIGEHTDYNMGFVLPAAVNKAAYIAIGEREDDEIHLIAADLDDNYITDMQSLKFSEKGWPNYIICIVDQLKKANIKIKGFNAVVSGDVPLGAGMSSSAAVECATVYALNELFKLKLDILQMVKMAQKAENEFVGVKCGIMDQFASMFGKKDHVIRLDCRSLAYDYVPFKLDGIKIVLFDSMVKHSLGSSEYNVRNAQCKEGVAIVKKKFLQVESLRDVTMVMLDECLTDADTKIYDRCKYVIEENERLLAACESLKQNDLKSFGERMYETHTGLSELYEVSCAELDFIVEIVKKEESILGARMMGGGFGGCVISLIKEDAIEEVTKRVKNIYKEKLNKDMNVYITHIEKGTHVVAN